jgi:hypothetical protein
MLVVGTVSTPEEQKQVRYIAEMVIISQRFRYLGRQEKNRKK